ncbi:hypothetical protein F4808DRAFT_309362 [Astrocystis sublimbata]|nr:hypothetical protein F4808DRAFT_309362 [Astrocystis sublimbata]
MQHTPNSSQQFAPRGVFTATRSFNDAVQASDAQGNDWADQQVKESEAAKNRLSDQKFNMREYPDPLVPRQNPQSHYYPRGVTAEMEKNLLDLVSRIKDGKQSA